MSKPIILKRSLPEGGLKVAAAKGDGGTIV
jgi:hypothetical protein